MAPGPADEKIFVDGPLPAFDYSGGGNPMPTKRLTLPAVLFMLATLLPSGCNPDDGTKSAPARVAAGQPAPVPAPVPAGAVIIPPVGPWAGSRADLEKALICKTATEALDLLGQPDSEHYRPDDVDFGGGYAIYRPWDWYWTYEREGLRVEIYFRSTEDLGNAGVPARRQDRIAKTIARRQDGMRQPCEATERRLDGVVAAVVR
jgi:hypothetical protein